MFLIIKYFTLYTNYYCFFNPKWKIKLFKKIKIIRNITKPQHNFCRRFSIFFYHFLGSPRQAFFPPEIPNEKWEPQHSRLPPRFHHRLRSPSGHILRLASVPAADSLRYRNNSIQSEKFWSGDRNLVKVRSVFFLWPL